MFNKNGLLYMMLDSKGNKVGVPIKASALYCKPTMKNLDGQFKVGAALKGVQKERLTKIIDSFFHSLTDMRAQASATTLTSMASKSRALHEYIVETGGKDHPNAKVKFNLGDVVTTIIQTAHGETIVVTHDTNTPRPKQNDYHVQGTRGLWMANTNSMYVEGISKDHKADVADDLPRARLAQTETARFFRDRLWVSRRPPVREPGSR